LGRLYHNQIVHAVEAGLHDAAQTGRAKCQASEEARFEFGPFFGLEQGFDFVEVLCVLEIEIRKFLN
jgi:hypothetical protein